MSLDSALRQSLIVAGDSITADAAEGLNNVVNRIATHRRRRVIGGMAVAFVLLVLLVISSRSTNGLVDAIPDVPPARERNERIEGDDGRDHAARRSQGLDVAGAAGSGVGTARARRSRHATGSGTTSETREPEQRSPRPAQAPIVAAAAEPRVVTESYRVVRAGGTHMGENAGLGCTDGAGMTGADDCFRFEVAADETSLMIEMTDVGDVDVPFRVNEYYGDTSRELGLFCTTTGDRIPVTPGSLLLVSIEGTDRCSDAAATSGRLLARFWKG